MSITDFCPKCRQLLVPQRKKDNTYLVCRICGFKRKASDKKSYKLKQVINEQKRRKTRVISETREFPVEGEEAILEDYYKSSLEYLAETEEGEEED
ncbi:MAG: DNA-directed RNA polymerase subunit M [Candidatus Methanomethylicia archaeon]